jgi:hypothetical protein
MLAAVLLTAPTITEVHSGPSTATFIVGLIVAGFLGPAVAAFASRWADRRRFDHERKLKASDDLIARVDEVAVALDELGAACAFMRQAALVFGVEQPDEVWPTVRSAEDAYQRTRASIARLGMRPHAHRALIAKATEASEAFSDTVNGLRTALLRRAAATKATGIPVSTPPDLSGVIAGVENGYTLTREYEALARDALGNLLATSYDTPPASRVGCHWPSSWPSRPLKRETPRENGA